MEDMRNAVAENYQNNIDSVWMVAIAICSDKNRSTEKEAIYLIESIISMMDNENLPHHSNTMDRLYIMFRRMVQKERFVVADFILSNGIDIDSTGVVYNRVTNESIMLTTLEAAIIGCYPPRCVEYLLDSGADRESKLAALECAVIQCHVNAIPERDLPILKLLITRRNYSVNSVVQSLAPILGGPEKPTVAEKIALWADSNPTMMDILVFFVFYLGDSEKISTKHMPYCVREDIDSIYNANKTMPDELLRNVAEYMI